MNTVIFFDLELTLIEDWSNPLLQHHANPALIPWIKQQGDFKAGLLSFAVWNERDLTVFNRTLRKDIEDVFGFSFDDGLMLIKDQLLAKTRTWEKMPFLSADDFSDFFNKRKAMEDLWLHEFQQPNTRVILLDDTVPNFTISSDEVDNCHLQLVNPLSASFQRHAQ